MRKLWEATQTTERVEEFKLLYQDTAVLIKQINLEFGWSPGATRAHEVAKRLGLPVRPPTYSKSKPEKPAVDLDQHIHDLERQLEEARLQKAQQGIRFIWSEDLENFMPRPDMLIIFGCGKDFRKLGGIPKLGEFLLKEGL